MKKFSLIFGSIFIAALAASYLLGTYHQLAALPDVQLVHLPKDPDPQISYAVGNQASLPDELKEHTLAKMKLGETAWTTPWAMWVDSNKKCWLNPEYTAMAPMNTGILDRSSLSDSPGGTALLKVTRTINNGFEVVNYDRDYRWSIVDKPFYAGQGDKGWIPVSKFTQ